VLKVSVQKTGSSTQAQRVLYLAGLELRTTKSGDAETESLQVIKADEAGRAQVRVLHRESGKPDGISNDQLRYSYDNLTGSIGLELDGDGNVISAEEYYPYGGTAVLTARSQSEVNYKTVRYSGKERDATGLYYYGYRYYQPWAGRWLSADPAGTADGLNLFRMVRNNPVTFIDNYGLSPDKNKAMPGSSKSESEWERKPLSRETEKKLDLFKSIYSSEAAYSQIKEMSKGIPKYINPDAVVKELKQRHPDHFEGRSGRTIESDLYSMASKIDVSMVRDINDYIYRTNKSKHKRGGRELYRGAKITKEDVKFYEEIDLPIYNKETLTAIYKPRTMLSFSADRSVATSFFQKRQGDTNILIVLENGFSGEGVNTALSVSDEAEYLYSTKAIFTHQSFQKFRNNSGEISHYQLNLKEITYSQAGEFDESVLAYRTL